MSHIKTKDTSTRIYLIVDKDTGSQRTQESTLLPRYARRLLKNGESIKSYIVKESETNE